MGTFVAFLFTSDFSNRTLLSIRRLQKGATIVGSGDFSLTIDEGSDDEIGDLARSFNQMILDLKTVTASKAEWSVRSGTGYGLRRIWFSQRPGQSERTGPDPAEC